MSQSYFPTIKNAQYAVMAAEIIRHRNFNKQFFITNIRVIDFKYVKYVNL